MGVFAQRIERMLESQDLVVQKLEESEFCCWEKMQSCLQAVRCNDGEAKIQKYKVENTKNTKKYKIQSWNAKKYKYKVENAKLFAGSKM